jgi:hypothetical protein
MQGYQGYQMRRCIVMRTRWHIGARETIQRIENRCFVSERRDWITPASMTLYSTNASSNTVRRTRRQRRGGRFFLLPVYDVVGIKALRGGAATRRAGREIRSQVVR